MTLSEAVVLLRGLAPKFLDGLTPSERTALCETATVKTFQAGTLITQEGFPATSVALLVRGLARFSCTTLDGGTVFLRRIHPGEVCGVAALLAEPVDYLLNAEAVKPSIALVWHRAAMRSFAMKCPRLLDNALLFAHDYGRWYKTAHISAMGKTARERLALVLGDLATGIGHKVEEGVEVTIRNEELASEANVTIFTASRLLNEWQRKGILVKTRGKVVLRSTKGLLRREA
jgi:CRP-like cAMP-binding protein